MLRPPQEKITVLERGHLDGPLDGFAPPSNGQRTVCLPCHGYDPAIDLGSIGAVDGNLAKACAMPCL